MMNSRADLLYPLSEFYTEMGLDLPVVSRLNGLDIPEFYRRLLVHDLDMTPTLEAAFHQDVHLRVLKKRISNKILTRQVVLMLDQDKVPIEFGAIKIHLDSVSYAAQEEIFHGRRPLGTILHRHHVEHYSRPIAFIRVEADSLLSNALGVQVQGAILYGRLNVLQGCGQKQIAEILEILPQM